jgi:hypothetical protein
MAGTPAAVVLIVRGQRIEVRGRTAAMFVMLATVQSAINEPFFGSVVCDFHDDDLSAKITRGVKKAKISELA